MRGVDFGLGRLNFFPAVAHSGILALKVFAAPFCTVRFCPTGGITTAKAPDWLAFPTVSCVDGS